MKPYYKHGLLFIALALHWLLAATALAQKTDELTLVNGNNITGEIKELDRGMLRLSTDSLAIVYIEWLDIASIESEKNFTVRTASGVMAFGTLSTSEDQQDIGVSYAGRTVNLKKIAVVEITRVKDTFWSRIDGSVSFGFSFKKANDDLQLNLSADSTYHGLRHDFNASLSALVSSQNESTGSERYTASISDLYSIRPKWFSLSQVQLEQNTELDLKMRMILQGGAAYRFLNTYRTRFASAAGLALNDERYFTAGKADRVSLEMFAAVGYEYFKFNTPKTDLSTYFTVYPSLTERGRIRTNLNTDISWEIIKDLSWVISLYLSTDNQPPEADAEEGTEEASGTDYGITTSLKWTF